MNHPTDPRALYTIAHIASQLLGRNLCPQITICNKLSKDFPKLYEHWSADKWIKLFNLERRNSISSIPWLDNVTTFVGASKLAKIIYNHFQEIRANQAHYITLPDIFYPNLLSCISKPPLALSVKGCLQRLTQPCISVVGSRKASLKSLEECKKIGCSLQEKKFVTISGGAYGCDIATHQGIVSNSKPPYLIGVVFAGGLGKQYPKTHTALFEEIQSQGGILISERLWNYSAKPYDFPIRNRIISGLSLDLIVMQATIKSGAMTTANHALNQGREVLVMRHAPHDVRASGNKRLIDDGASAFPDADSLIKSYC